MNKKIRLGIIGLGAEGAMYANFLRDGRVDNMEIGAICDILPEKKEQAGEYGVPFYADYKELVTSGDVDAIVTTVPHYLHPEIGIFALENNVHALVEKPVGVYTKQAKELIEFAKTKPELKFGVFFNQRTNQLYKDLKSIMDSGELGKLRHTSWIITTWWRPQGYYNQSDWRATWGGEGGGVLVNQAPHQLDLWQWICGTPEKVFARNSYGFRRDIAVEDEVHALVSFPDGASGAFITCTHDMIGTDRLEILCDKGKIVVDDSKKVTISRLVDNEEVLSQNMDMEDVRKLFTGQLDMTKYLSVETKAYESVWGEQHCEVMRNFAAAIHGEEELLAPGSDGIYGVALANGIHLSSWTGEEVDLVNFDEQTYLNELNKRIEAEGKFEVRN
ncbi:putative dehydrogenase [Corynebacterium suranareeae]|uniref:Putative dehydrogenase n=1 Tax=Corynebacterium suranareeae TaxID=2506452 RepID=A0A160PU72_9CORY|nr:Gfo/Idh/MocA family oxidoreductase [Corynebacterium suranareeae]BAU96893.1 putative dehydrogenase [Corynebacterium suranareeae]